MRRTICLMVLALLAGLAGRTAAQDGAKRPVRMIVPVAPAGSTDIIGRTVSARLSERIGQQVVVDNRPGAGGLIGVDLVAKSQPDGHTLLMGAGSLGTINSFFPKAPFHVQKDLDPIALAGDRCTQDRLGRSIGIHIGGIEEIHAGIDRQVDDSPRLRDIGITPRVEERPLPAERACAEPECRHLEARSSEKPVFHRFAPEQ